MDGCRFGGRVLFGGSHGFAFFFGRLFVIFASIIGAIKSTSLENQSRARTQQPAHFSLSPSALTANIPRACCEGRIFDGLKYLEGFMALQAFVFVGGHGCNSEQGCETAFIPTCPWEIKSKLILIPE